MPQLLPVLFLFATTVLALASPVVVVRGASQFSELTSEYQNGGLQVSGRLLDDSGHPIGDARIELQSQKEQRTTRTKEDGRFNFNLPGRSDRPSSVILTFAGAEFISSCKERMTVPPRPETARLELALPTQIDFGAAAAIEVLATQRKGAPLAGINVGLYLKDKQISRCKTNGGGRCSWRLKSLAVGVHKLRVVGLDGPQKFANATAEILVSAKLNATVSFRERIIRDTPHISVSVRMDGLYPADTAISLRTKAGAIAQTSVQQGRIKFEIPVSTLNNTAEFQVVARSRHIGWTEFESAPFAYKKPSTMALNTMPRWALAICLVGAIAIFIRRQKKDLPEARVHIDPMTDLGSNVEFFQEADASTSPIVFVRCACTGRSLNARITACLQSDAKLIDRFGKRKGSNSQLTDDEGQAPLEPGIELFLVESEGFVPELVRVSRSGASIRVRLWTHRASVQIRFMELLATAGFPIIKFGVHTVREATPKLIKRGFEADNVWRLASWTEQLCFGPTTPTLSQVGDYHRMADTVGELNREAR
mgnify:CR=1 FL=1